MRRAVRALYWIAPCLFCLWVYWLGLWAWFQQDDFAWLHLRHEVHSSTDLWRILTVPMAQGTWRPLSERVFFMGFSALFGLDALPYRAGVFLTQFANLILLSSIAWRLTGSRAAGFLAAVFWTANSALSTAMAWTSAYNQALCGFFLLLSFHFLLRHIETGRLAYYIAQWVTFLAGFTVLEINVVYPALAAAYTICCARTHFRRTLPLFVPSAAYVAFHNWIAPKASSGTYGMHFDTGMFSTLWTYWDWALGPSRLAYINVPRTWFEPAAAAALSAGLLGFAAWKLRRRQWTAAFLLAWFLIVIAPVLPLPYHVSDYYLTLPTVGLAMLGGWAVVSGLRAGWGPRAVALVLAGIYLGTTVPAARGMTRWQYLRSRAVETLVRGVERAHQLHPGKVILLTNVSSDLFWAGVFDNPFRLVGVREVYLAPGSDQSIQAQPDLGDITDYVLSAGLARRALESGQAVVYASGEDRLRNVTPVFKRFALAHWKEEQPRRVDAGHPLFETQLGPTWYPIEGGHRWMPGQATVRLAGPRSAAEKLYISGFCPAAQLKNGPVTVRIAVDGNPLPPAVLSQPDAPFNLSYSLPPSLAGKPAIEIAISVDRTFVPPEDGRQLGAAFGVFEIR